MARTVPDDNRITNRLRTHGLSAGLRADVRAENELTTPNTHDAEPSAPTQLTPAQLAQIVAAAVAQTIAATSSNKDSQLAEAVAAAVVAVSPKRRGPYKCRSVFNPEGKKRELSRPVFQNGHRINVKLLHDAELALLEQLQPGKFLDGLIVVVEQPRAGSTEPDLHIRYGNKTADQRAILSDKLQGGGFLSLVRTCVREHSEQRVAARSALRAQLEGSDVAEATATAAPQVQR